VIDRYIVPWELPPRDDWFDEYGFSAPARITQKQHIRDVSAEGVVIVSGEPWIGKTHVFNHLVEDLRPRERFVDRLSLEDGDRAAAPTWWEHWKSSTQEAWWFIDAVDEALHLGNASISDVLRPALELRAERPRLHLVVFTRDDDSLSTIRSQLEGGGFRPNVRRLLPFDRNEARRIIGDDSRFAQALTQLRDPSLKGLARFQPVLRALATATAHRSKADLLRDALEALCSEHFGRRRERTESLSKEDAFLAASRLASVMLLCDRTTVQLDIGVGHLSLRDVFPSQPHLRLAAEQLRNSVLFRKTSEGHRFRQRFVMELLAGFGLRDVTPEAFRLITRGNASFFPPRLEALERTLLDLDARALADALPDLTSIETRRTVAWAEAKIDALVSAVGDARWYPSHREDVLKLLNVPGLAGVLDARLGDKGLPERARDLLFRVASSCDVSNLVSRAVQIASDVDEPPDLRTTATYYATRYGDQETLAALRELLRLPDERQPVRARARILELLVQRGSMDPLEAATLTPEPQKHLYDARSAAVSAMEEHLTLLHARVVIDEWIGAFTPPRTVKEGVRERLRKRSVELLLKSSLASDEDTRRLANLIRIDSSHTIVKVDELWDKLEREPLLRKGLYRDLLDSKELWRVSHVLGPDDVSWLLEVAGTDPGKRALDDLYGLMRRLGSDDPRRDAIAHFFGAHYPEEAARREAAWSEGEAQRREFEQRMTARLEQSPPVPIARVVSKLLEPGSAPSNALRELGLVCFAEAPFRPDDVAGSFSDLSLEVQLQVIARVRACLQVADPEPVPAPHETVFSSHLVYEASAFRAALTFDRDRSWLSPTLIRRWLPGALFALHDDVPTIVSELLKFASEATREQAFRAVERDISARAHSELARRLPVETWSDEFCDRVGNLVLASREPGAGSRCSLLRALALRSPPAGARFARGLLVDGTAPREIWVVAADVLLAIEPTETGWSQLDAVIQQRADVEQMKGLLNDLGGDPHVDPGRLPGALLAPLAERLWQLYPRNEDPDRLGPRWIGSDDKAREARDSVLKALVDRARHSVEAAATVERIGAADTWFADWAAALKAADAITAVLATIVPEPVVPTVEEVVRALDEASFRPIRTELDLWRLVIEILRSAISPTVGYDVDLLYDVPRHRGRTRMKPRANEGKLQAYVRRRLEDLFPQYNDSVSVRPLLVREAQEQFRRRCDILVVAALGTQLASVAVEIKWSHDPRCTRSLKTQLVDKYLLQHGRRHGVYLVGWSGTPRAVGWDRHRATHATQFEQVLMAHPDLRVVPAYLACPWTDASAEATRRANRRAAQRRSGRRR
jgi:hypothetical protein